MTDIIYTDRYGGHPPSWLTACHGQCEAMGVYPVYADDTTLTVAEHLEIGRIISEQGAESDGAYFIRCPDCHGTGRVPWQVWVWRIPRWLWRKVGFVRMSLHPSMKPDWASWPRWIARVLRMAMRP